MSIRDPSWPEMCHGGTLPSPEDYSVCKHTKSLPRTRSQCLFHTNELAMLLGAPVSGAGTPLPVEATWCFHLPSGIHFSHLLVTEHAVLGGLTLPPGAGGHLTWLIRPFDLATVIASGTEIQTEPALGRSCCQDTLFFFFFSDACH